MAFSEFETKKYETIVAAWVERHRPPPHIRGQLDFGFRMSGQSVEIFTVRPSWVDPNERIEGSLAKATYVKSKGIWKIYWMRADLKWHRYDPDPEVETFEDFLQVVDADEYCCFFG